MKELAIYDDCTADTSADCQVKTQFWYVFEVMHFADCSHCGVVFEEDRAINCLGEYVGQRYIAPRKVATVQNGASIVRNLSWKPHYERCRAFQALHMRIELFHEIGGNRGRLKANMAHRLTGIIKLRNKCLCGPHVHRGNHAFSVQH